MRTQPKTSITVQEARRIALRAQGFGARGESPPNSKRLLKLVRQIGLLQLDSVNVLIRSHYLPLFARLGPYSIEQLDTMSNRAPRKLFEYWGHEASLIPVEFQPLFRWRMEEAAAGKSMWAGPAKIAHERPEFIQRVIQEIRDRGPIGAGELSEGGKSTGNWWGWSDGKRALEYLFWTGQLTSAGRRGFERLYELPERVIPNSIHTSPSPSREDAQRELIRIAAKAFGVATETDLRDYFRLSPADCKARVRDLVSSAELQEVQVEGWEQSAYLHKDANLKPLSATALISPFDSLIWSRPRTERLFNFHYRLAFYTPKHKRTQGYYVMPFLCGSELVARLDLKSDRKAKKLLVLGGHAEPGASKDDHIPAMRQELKQLAQWLGLERVVFKARTDLINRLRH